MTKERFEEIRKREYAEDRVVYAVFYNDKKVIPLCIVNDDEWLIAYLNLNSIYETKEQAEWALKTYVTRTERFEPPMWEEIGREEEYIFRFVANNEFIYFEVNKDEDIDFDSIIIFNTTRNKYIFNKWSNDATKENYEKACEIVRDLFKGEERK